MSIWRRIRGVLGIGSVWAVPAAVVGAIGGAVASWMGALPLFPSVASGVLMMGSVFFMLGSGFATVLALAERRRTAEELSPIRGGLWGALGGAAVMIANAAVILGLSGAPVADPAFVSALFSSIAIYAGLGGALGSLTIGIAQRAPAAELEPAADPPPALPSS